MEIEYQNSVGIVRSGWPVISKRLHNCVTVGIPTASALLGIASGAHISSLATALGLSLFLAGGIGIGIGLHRYFSHHAFETGPLGRLILGVLGSWAWQGPIDQWVADHRRHHRFADTPLDPHSPHWIENEPAPNRFRGLLHAHMGWMIAGDVSAPERYAADIVNDPISRGCSHAYWPLALSTLLIPWMVGYAVGGGAEAWACLVWAGFVRVAAVQHFTWAIASIGHSFGSKVPESKDEARDSVLLALLLFGEGLHSFHHANPSCGVNQPAALDLNGLILRAAEKVGWIRGLNRS